MTTYAGTLATGAGTSPAPDDFGVEGEGRSARGAIRIRVQSQWFSLSDDLVNLTLNASAFSTPTAGDCNETGNFSQGGRHDHKTGCAFARYCEPWIHGVAAGGHGSAGCRPGQYDVLRHQHRARQRSGPRRS